MCNNCGNMFDLEGPFAILVRESDGEPLLKLCRDCVESIAEAVKLDLPEGWDQTS